LAFAACLCSPSVPTPDDAQLSESFCFSGPVSTLRRAIPVPLGPCPQQRGQVAPTPLIRGLVPFFFFSALSLRRVTISFSDDFPAKGGLSTRLSDCALSLKLSILQSADYKHSNAVLRNLLLPNRQTPLSVFNVLSPLSLFTRTLAPHPPYPPVPPHVPPTLSPYKSSPAVLSSVNSPVVKRDLVLSPLE